MTRKNIIAPLWRAILGSAAGGVLGPIIFYVFSPDEASAYRLLTLVFSVTYLLFIIVIGTVVGIVIWGLTKLNEGRRGLLFRALIGIICGIVLGLLCAYILYIYQDAAVLGIKFQVYTILIKLGAIIGILAGISAISTSYTNSELI